MKPPSTPVRVIGHPVLSGLLLAAGMAFVAFCLFRGGDGVIPAVIVGFLLNRVMKAQEQERDYRAWKAAWDAMGPDAPRKRRPWRLAVKTIAGLAVALYALANLGDPQIQLAVTFIAAGLMVGVVIKLRGRSGWSRRRAPRAAKSKVATIAARNGLPTPTLRHAYQALPDYCQRLIRQG